MAKSLQKYNIFLINKFWDYKFWDRKHKNLDKKISDKIVNKRKILVLKNISNNFY